MSETPPPPPEPTTAEKMEAAMHASLEAELEEELEAALGEPTEDTAEQRQWYCDLHKVLYPDVEIPPDLGPAAVVEVPGDVSAVAAGTARAAVEEMVGDGVDLQQEFHHPAAAVATQVVQQPAVGPWVLGSLGMEEAPKHGPDTGDAEMEQRMLGPAAAAVATTQTMQHDVLAPAQRETYSQTSVIHFINHNRWIDLERYLLSCMPQDGKDLTMEHAHLFLCCRKGNLVTILNDPKCDPMEAESYLKTSILPLSAATGKYVNSVQLNRDTQSIRDCFYERRNITNIGAQDFVKDYMDFHFPNETRYKHGRSVAWHFMSKIEAECSKGRGTVLVRCKLWQNRMPTQNSVRSSVVSHIGCKKYPNLTLFAQELYNSIIIGVQLKQKMGIVDNTDPLQLKKNKRKLLGAVDDRGPGKTQRVDTTQGGLLLKDINNSIDDVPSSVNDLCLISNPHNKATVKHRIHSSLGKIKNSVALLVAQIAARTMAGLAVPPFESNKVMDVAGASVS